MSKLTFEECQFLIYCIRVTPYFYKNKLKDSHKRLIMEGYLRMRQTFCGPLKIPDPEIITLSLTEAGRIIAEQLIFPS